MLIAAKLLIGLIAALHLHFLRCIAIAGIYGAATAARRILFVQAVPALLVLALLWLGWAGCDSMPLLLRAARG